MAIDVSRVKRTRGGHEVRIYATDGNGLYPIHGAIMTSDWWAVQTWTNDGKFQCGPANEYDLIEEPRTVEIDWWLNVYPSGDFTEYPTKEMADAAALKARFACINIKRTVTEGEGL